MHYKVEPEGRVQSRCVYNILGITTEGRKEILGMYVCESEGANFWLSILTDLQTRGVNYIPIACIDNLRGFAEAISTVSITLTEQERCNGDMMSTSVLKNGRESSPIIFSKNFAFGSIPSISKNYLT